VTRISIHKLFKFISAFNSASNPFARPGTKQPPKTNVTSNVVKTDVSREQLKKKILDALESDTFIDPSLVQVQSSILADNLENEVCKLTLS